MTIFKLAIIKQRFGTDFYFLEEWGYFYKVENPLFQVISGATMV
jgi:hypothetical protein